MSRPDSSKRSLPGEKPKSDIYTMMLIIALIAISVGCLLLALELQSYGSIFSAWKTR